MQEMNMTTATANFTTDDFASMQYKGAETQVNAAGTDELQTSKWRTKRSQSSKDETKSTTIPRQDSGHAPGPTDTSDKSAALEEKLNAAVVKDDLADFAEKAKLQKAEQESKAKQDLEEERLAQIEKAQTKAAFKHDDNPMSKFLRAFPLTTLGDEHKVRYTHEGKNT